MNDSIRARRAKGWSSRRHVALMIVFFLAVGFGLWLLIHRLVGPYDCVSVSVADIPPDANRVFLIADTAEGRKVVMVYDHCMLFAFRNHPDDSVSSSCVHDDKAHKAGYEWVEQSRLGVLYGSTKTGIWHLAWFNPPKNRLEGKSWLTGGGHWIVRLGDADEVEEVSLTQLDACGLKRAAAGK